MVERVLLGKHPDTSEYGLWISKPTKNARTSTNTDDFLFDPSKALARPFIRGDLIQFTKGAFDQVSNVGDGTWWHYYFFSFQFTHGLGYVPLFSTQGIGTQSTGGSIVFDPWCDASTYNCTPFMNSFAGINSQATVRRTSATPGAGSVVQAYEDSKWRFDVALDKIISKATPPACFAIYRNAVG